ncbi:MAG: aspartyl protease family protein [Alphaproteobacteria bacterium]
MGSHRILGIVFGASLLAATSPALAADCSLKILASIETARNASGGMLVPVTITGAKKTLLLDTGGYFSEITPQATDQLGLKRRNIGIFQYNAWGHPVTQRVRIRGFALGNVKAESVDFMVGTAPAGVDGTLAPNLFRAYDVELDFAGNKLTLVSPDHCKGQVVYWPHTAVAAVPMRVTETGRIVFPVSLDGSRLQAMLDTGAARTTISTAAAQKNFGISMRAGTHRFKTLSIDGVTVNNPEIALSANVTRAPRGELEGLPSADIRRYSPDLLIGMSTLKHLHVYIAYSEQMLYFTAGVGTPAARASGR